jgi:ABC-type transport system involved in cytochrome c biogenesis permease subunit
MASNPLAPLAAAVCLLLAGLALLRAWRVGAWLGAAGVAILTGALVARGLQACYWPLTSEYEFALAFALGTALATLALSPRRRELAVELPAQRPEAMAMILAAALVVYARLVLPDHKRAIQPLIPALDSTWLPLHVGTAALAYGALALAGAAGLVWLLWESDRPTAQRLLHQAIATGYPLLTLSMIFGMIWAQAAWGRYWGWDLKEVWTLITWLLYTLYWHLHRRPSWQGRGEAWLSVLGVGAVLFTFLGVSWLARLVGLESLHLF